MVDTPGSTKSDRSDAASEKSSTSTSSVFGIAPLKTPRDVNKGPFISDVNNFDPLPLLCA